MLRIVTGDGSWSSRVGPVLQSSSWLGSTIDWTIDAQHGWVCGGRVGVCSGVCVCVCVCVCSGVCVCVCSGVCIGGSSPHLVGQHF